MPDWFSPFFTKGYIKPGENYWRQTDEIPKPFTHRVPHNWPEGKLLTIYKKGDKSDPNNYRPIVLLNSIPKLFSSILAFWLRQWLEKLKILPDKQAGFRPFRSCLDQIFILKALVQSQVYHKNNKLFATFIDLSKALDSVDHTKLWSQLENQNINSDFIQLLKSLYKNASIRVSKGKHSISIPTCTVYIKMYYKETPWVHYCSMPIFSTF